MMLSRKLVVIAVSVLVLLIGGGVAYAANTPAARMQRELNLGNKYLQEGKYEEAILAFEKVIEIDQKNIPARMGLGTAYIAIKDYSKAEAVYKEIIAFEPNNLDAKQGLFKVYLGLANFDAAKDVLADIETIDTKKDMKQLKTDLDNAKAINDSKSGYEQGITQLNNKQYADALDSLGNVIKDDKERYDDAQKKISECEKFIPQPIVVNVKWSGEPYKSVLALSSNQVTLKVGQKLQLKYGDIRGWGETHLAGLIEGPDPAKIDHKKRPTNESDYRATNQGNMVMEIYPVDDQHNGFHAYHANLMINIE